MWVLKTLSLLVCETCATHFLVCAPICLGGHLERWCGIERGEELDACERRYRKGKEEGWLWTSYKLIGDEFCYVTIQLATLIQVKLWRGNVVTQGNGTRDFHMKWKVFHEQLASKMKLSASPNFWPIDLNPLLPDIRWKFLKYACNTRVVNTHFIQPTDEQTVWILEIQDPYRPLYLCPVRSIPK